jgi:CRISPR/Cas system-associated exonuclease Cas4 (RecB family)
MGARSSLKLMMGIRLIDRKNYLYINNYISCQVREWLREIGVPWKSTMIRARLNVHSSLI